MQERIEQVIKIVEQYGSIDGAHHKTWVIDQIMRTVLGENYEAWVAEQLAGRVDNAEEAYWEEWDVGIAP